jgi:hypothetical protein
MNSINNLFELKNHKKTVLHFKRFPYKFLNFHPLDNGNVIVFYKEPNGPKFIDLYNQNLEFIKSFEQHSFAPIVNIDSSDDIKDSIFNFKLMSEMRKLDHLIKFNYINTLTTFQDCAIMNAQSKNKWYLVILDENIRSDIEFECKKVYKSICANSQKIICLTNKNTLDIYNWQLKLLSTVGTNKIYEPYCIFSHRVLGIQCLNNKLIIRSRNDIIIINLSTGIQENCIKIRCLQIVLSSDHFHAIVRSGINLSCITFNTNGELIHNKQLQSFFEGDFFFFNKKNKYIYNRHNSIVNIFM